MGNRLRALIGLLLALGLWPGAASAAFDPVREVQNFSKQSERTLYDQGVEFQRQVVAQQPAGATRTPRIVLDDPSRRPLTTCLVRPSFCQGDPRLYDWAGKYGVVRDVQFVNRDGATIVGHIWARFGPHRTRPASRRPGIVLTDGFEFPEEYYWHAAQVLAAAGYLVMTFDTQGAGHSDSIGEGPETLRSVPSVRDGNPFYEGTEDALDFFTSTPRHPYVPRSLDGSRYAGGAKTAGQQKQAARVAAGRANAYNPLRRLLRRRSIGLVGHSYGAAGVSHVGQRDARVDAIVSWDNIVEPLQSSEVRVPGLNFSEDYPDGSPITSEPDPDARNADYLAYHAAGVDSMQVNLRGGTHREYSYLPEASDATLRGIDTVDWYTTAWFDKYLKGDPTADARLLTARWRSDAAEAAVDPTHDGNMFSFYFRSPVAFTLADGTRADCADLRSGDGCGLRADDGYPGQYSFLEARTGR
jgi:dienelactone hydrolase